jgi:peptidoglycan/LPS O-acetylase OafA/YrhL
MFGSYRFLLAILVALSHFGCQAAGFNPGQWAVISFYVLSGLLMDRQFHKLSPRGKELGGFYLDRFLRVYPLFMVVLLLMKAKIIITPKKAVLDPQGKTVQNALAHMGYTGVTGVHIGKYIEIDLAPAQTPPPPKRP